MATNQAKPQSASNMSAMFPYIVIPILFIVAILVYMFVFGDPKNFIDNDPSKDPKEGNYFGIIYKGGWVVPILLTCFLIVITFVIERWITIRKAQGTGSMDNMVRALNNFLDKNDVTGALAWCDKQKGSVASVMKNGLHKYSAMANTSGMDVSQKVIGIQKEVEEATSLELPMLEKNLNILATIASIATLLGLFGTVLGMIRSFAALATSGAPDSTALATGISEALINTALGIGTSTIAIIAYNFFTAKIDNLTYKIDEVGYSLTQSFAERFK